MTKPDPYVGYLAWLKKMGLPDVPRDVYEKELRKIPDLAQPQNADIILMKDRGKKRDRVRTRF